MARLLICLLAGAASLAMLQAQEGYPLSGTWAGDWGPTPTQRTHITFVMNWDGKTVTGTLNPGPDQVAVTSIVLDPATWTVRIEADTKDKSGMPVHISAEGRLEEIGSYHRKIAGTWHEGKVNGDFRLTRD